MKENVKKNREKGGNYLLYFDIKKKKRVANVKDNKENEDE